MRDMGAGHQVACHFPLEAQQVGTVIHGPDSGLTAQPDESRYFSESITDLGAVGTTRLDSANSTDEGI